MEEFIVRLTFLGVGVILGYATSSAQQTKRYAREVLAASQGTSHPTSGKSQRGGATADFSAWIILLAIVGFSVYSTASTNDKLENADSAREAQTDCTAKFFVDTIETLNTRVPVAGPVNDAAEVRIKEQAILFGFISDLFSRDAQDGDREKLRDAIKSYNVAINNYLNVAEKADKVRENNEYPTSKDYLNCLRDNGAMLPAGVQEQ